ncbi:MAG: glycosyltransferase [Candidatus Heimdallarchaeota archaeon]|nr:glycosyltransferase [Candidatus Heimdallarchaeota archaeon]MCK5048747.1 glycosyltransferase [Candidatus Heimdallarchaeota archaeon]
MTKLVRYLIKLGMILIAIFMVVYPILSFIECMKYLQEDYSLNRLGEFSINILILLFEIISLFYSLLLYYYIESSMRYKLPPLELPARFNGELPKVTINYPLYDEPFEIVYQTLLAALEIDYPKELVEIIVCDDSAPSENRDKIESFCKENGIKVFHRDNRKGFKAGALNEMLQIATGSFFIILDSDHLADPQLIHACLSGFIKEDTLGVQAKPLFVNQDNWLMKASAFIHTQFFHVYQKSRSTRGATIFAGTTCCFNTEIIKECGGFLEETIAEDTDTTMVLHSKGYRLYYVDRVGSRGLVPWTPISMIKQIWRWSNGIARIFRIRTRQILRGKASKITKVDYFFSAFVPIFGVLIWIFNLVVLGFYYADIPFIRWSAYGDFTFAYFLPIFFIGPILASLGSLILSLTSALAERKTDRMIQVSNAFSYSLLIGVFFIFTLAAQPFLVWGVITALIGRNKEFERTVKNRSTKKTRISEKYRYAIEALALGMVGFFFIYTTIIAALDESPLAGWFAITGIAAIAPLIVTFIYFPKLDKFRDEVRKRTVKDYL